MIFIIGAPSIDIKAPEYKNKYIIIDMGVSGAKELKKLYNNIICVYIVPPTKERLMSQMGEKAEERFQNSKKELDSALDTFNWLIINDDVNVAVKEIQRLMYSVKKFGPKFGKADMDTLSFLYDKNLRNEENVKFLKKFYNAKEKKDIER